MKQFCNIVLVVLVLCCSVSWADDSHHHSGHPAPPCPPGHWPPGYPPYYGHHPLPVPPVPPPEWLGPEGFVYFPFWYYQSPYYPDVAYPQQEQKPQYYQGVKTAGELRVKVVPPEAVVMVDGQTVTDRDSTQAYTIGLLTGKHTLEVTADGYQEKIQDVEIYPARTTSISIELKRR
ncbi:MAG TPA: PEGA domain-containing protein [Thermodesulfobacteriota bacterium]|nr:PEGA domain-containing protein [Deltaproteobacteria bacterium]HQO78860.1 PEGA domain-containing protein [Thermodesulfobacteriota bacterium]